MLTFTATKEEQIKQLKKLVRKEAANLRLHATQEELNKLNFSELNAASTSKCVYGQMTGFCYSDRANELIVLCAERVYNTRPQRPLDSFSDIDRLNGKPFVVYRKERATQYHSPIELFISLVMTALNDNDKALIDYLQGRRETLRFK